jgi:hypothetical protein
MPRAERRLRRQAPAPADGIFRRRGCHKHLSIRHQYEGTAAGPRLPGELESGRSVGSAQNPSRGASANVGAAHVSNVPERQRVRVRARHVALCPRFGVVRRDSRFIGSCRASASARPTMRPVLLLPPPGASSTATAQFRRWRASGCAEGRCRAKSGSGRSRDGTSTAICRAAPAVRSRSRRARLARPAGAAPRRRFADARAPWSPVKAWRAEGDAQEKHSWRQYAVGDHAFPKDSLCSLCLCGQRRVRSHVTVWLWRDDRNFKPSCQA